MSNPGDSQIVNYVVRMVVPMRREFGRSIDVQQFLRDGEYAKAVLEEALTSQDARLVEYATYVSQRLLSARVAAAPAPAAARAALAPPAAAAAAGPAAAPAAGAPVPAASGAAAPGVPPGESAADRERALRERVLDKYRRGLR
ncbi:MAG: hypothetical protein ACK5UM_17775 [Pseudomonadota bacterium]|nr:hypothetical protein [Rubrivivax sp.]MCA3260141.1 hypothetical protein [Rubrivivax sp.]MCZ8032921.1 hypothetical protein [Rubrivivax sp.]